MSEYEQVRFLAGPESRITVLQTLKSEPATVETLENQLSISESTIERYLTCFIDFGWVENIQKRHKIKSAGRVVLREYQKTLDDMNRGEFEFLAGSQNATRPRLLRVLSEPATRPELADQMQMSDATLYRTFTKDGGFEDNGWILKRGDGQYILTATGEDVLEAYDKFIHGVRVVDKSGIFLDNFEADPAPPIHVLEHSSAESTRYGAVHVGLDALLDVLRTRPSRLRAVGYIISAPFTMVYTRLLERGVEIDSVLDEQALRTYKEQYPNGFERSLEAETVDFHVHPEIGFQLAIFDDEQVLLGVYNEHSDLRAGIVETEEDIVAWAVELFERYRNEAQGVTYFSPTVEYQSDL